jgi:hypothetical protein
MSLGGERGSEPQPGDRERRPRDEAAHETMERVLAEVDEEWERDESERC